MPNILDAIQVSGASYDLKDKNAPSVSSLTQSEYDNLPSTAKTSNTFFVITDAQAGDLTNYYTKTETNTLLDDKADTATTYTKTEVDTLLDDKADTATTYTKTEVDTLLDDKADTATTYTKTETDNAITAGTSTKQDTLVSGTNIKTINNESILGSGNIDIQGGGKAVTGGTNISVTTGETADTINCTLPITAITSDRKNDIAIGNDIVNGASSYKRLIIGNGNKFKYANSRTSGSILIAAPSNTSSVYNVVNAASCIGIGGNGIEVGYDNITGAGSIAIGFNTKSLINYSLAIGTNTVASGTTKTNINNQLKIDTSNQIYIMDKTNTNEICLQDYLGGGGASYSAGTGIDITNNVISVSGVVETSAITTAITSSSTDAQVPSAKAVYDIVGDIETLLSQI